LQPDGSSMPNANLLRGMLEKFDIHLDELGHSTGVFI